MKSVVITALLLLLFVFLLPLVLFGGTSPALPLPTSAATLPPGPEPVGGPEANSLDAQRTLTVALEDGQVVTHTLSDYLWRVVAAEMPASFEFEALKAQAVAARTYTLSKLARSRSANHPDADLCSDITCCQAYLNPLAAAVNWGDGWAIYSEKITRAVAETDGMVILYEGQPIDAVFHSSSAGRTLNAQEVWGNAVSYLTGVDSPEGDEVPNYRTTNTFTPQEFKTLFLERYPDAKLEGDPARWFGAVSRSSNGGVSTISVGGVTVSGPELRTLCSLRSAFFTVTADKSTVTFSVTGYGHGVGMSQYGANTLAKQGKTYEEILRWYYTDVSVEEYP